MRRALGILWRVGAGVSLLLCIGVVWVWVASNGQAQGWRALPYSVAGKEYREDWVGSERGRLHLHRWKFVSDPGAMAPLNSRGETVIAGLGVVSDERRWREEWGYLPVPAPANWLESRGFYVRHQSYRNWRGLHGIESSTLVVAPYWCLAMMLLIWPGVWGAGWWKRRRNASWVREGRCGRCGYDMRATPQVSGVWVGGCVNPVREVREVRCRGKGLGPVFDLPCSEMFTLAMAGAWRRGGFAAAGDGIDWAVGAGAVQEPGLGERTLGWGKGGVGVLLDCNGQEQGGCRFRAGAVPTGFDRLLVVLWRQRELRALNGKVDRGEGCRSAAAAGRALAGQADLRPVAEKAGGRGAPAEGCCGRAGCDCGGAVLGADVAIVDGAGAVGRGMAAEGEAIARGAVPKLRVRPEGDAGEVSGVWDDKTEA